MSIENKDRLRSNPKEKSFSATGLETYLTCPRQFYFKYLNRLVIKKARTPLIFGSAIHQAVGTFYTYKDDDALTLRIFNPDIPKDISDDMLLEYLCVMAFKKVWEEGDTLGDEKRNLETGLTIISKYIKTYKRDSATYLPEYIESNSSIMMPNDTLLICIIDRIQKESNYIVICDTKTSSWSFTDFYFKKYINSFQLSSYFYATEALLGSCDAVLVDGILVPPKGKEDFVRRTFLRTEHQMAEFLNLYFEITNRIMDDLELSEEKTMKKFFCNPMSCDKFGGCDYIPLCQYGYTKSSLCMYEREGEGEEDASDV